jgi:hypothetical protein
MYLRIGLSGFAFLALLTAVLRLLRAPATWGFFILTSYWIGLCLVVGLVRAVRRLASR